MEGVGRLIVVRDSSQYHPKGAKCEECPLLGKPLVLSEGNPDADIMLVGEAPGAEEAKLLRPFVGQAGQLLMRMFGEVGINRRDVYITNAVLCRPDENATPTNAMVQACSDRLVLEVQRVRPKVLVALGAVATRALTGELHISSVRGLIRGLKETYGDLAGTPVVLTWHPANVLRNPGLYQDVVQDLRKALAILRGSLRREGLSFREVVVPDLGGFKRLLRETPFCSWDGGKGVVCVDVETASSGRLLCLSLALATEQELVSDVVVLGKEVVTHPLFPAIWNEWARRQRWLGHNLKYDARVLREHGLWVEVSDDSMLMAYALDERTAGEDKTPGSTKGLKGLAENVLGIPQWDEELKRFKAAMEQVPEDKLYHYNAYDVAVTVKLWQELSRRLAQEGQTVAGMYRNLLIPASNVLLRIEEVGVRVDRDVLLGIGKTIEDQMDVERRRFAVVVKPYLPDLNRRVGAKKLFEEVNLNSSKQLSVLLYDVLGLPEVQTSVKVEKSTDATVLEAALNLLSNMEDVENRAVLMELLDILLRYRKASKLHSAFVAGLLEKIQNDGRVHAQFKLHATVTGRLSSSNPNLQQIPRDDGSEVSIRRAFVATPGYTWVKADLEQAELRVMAALSGDEVLAYALENDVHRTTIASILGKNPEDVTSQERQLGKRVNFAVLYGAEENKIAEVLGISEQEAAEVIRKWRVTFKKAAAWQDELKRQILTLHYVETVFGRRRRFPYIPSYGAARGEVFRQIVNFPIQSTASDIVLSALVRIGRQIDWSNTRLLLTVHDEIDLETKEDVREVAEMLEREMTTTPFSNIRFASEVKCGPSWGVLGDIPEKVGGYVAVG